MKVLSLFSGIGAFEKALQNIGIKYELVGFSEIDKYAIKSYCAVHNVSEEFNLGDITKIDIEKLPKDIDLITHGSPCQDFSIAGHQAGGDFGTGTRSALMWNTVSIVKECKPKYVVWENVRNLLSSKHKHNFDSYLKVMNEIGYINYYQILNAKNYEIPQNRDRIYTISIRKDIKQEFIFPEKEELKLKLRDMLEDEVNQKYFLSNTGIEYFKKQAENRGENLDNYNENRLLTVAHGTSKGNNKNLDICPTLDTQFSNCWRGVLLIKNATKKGYMEAENGDSINLAYPNRNTRRGRVGKQISQTLTTSDNMGVVQHYRIRKLTPLECWRLMGFDDQDFYKAQSIGISDSQLYKQAGNSIVVKVLEKIFINLLKGAKDD